MANYILPTMPDCIHNLRDLIIEDILVCSTSTSNISFLRYSFNKTNVNYFNGFSLEEKL